ncbi:TrmB family transcriptional regulator [Nakamurella lactea]|uniref:TrmB family transcriptional regulator n=1 Tax=Nakamurella lactea TaxID=459515 RepID=UPI0004241FB6|nr:hypothetical protein [Nakamurella lactea]
MLQILGLTAHEEALFEFMVSHPPAAPRDLIRWAREVWPVPVSATVASALAGLRELGLIADPTPDNPRFVVIPPDTALDQLAQQRARDLAAARRHLIALSARYRHRSPTAGAGSTPLVEVIHGSVEILRRFEEIQRGARSEVCGFDAPPYLSVVVHSNPLEAELLRAGIRYRVLYDRRGIDLPGRPAEMAALAELGEVARVAELPVKLTLTDQPMGMVLLHTNSDPTSALVIHDSTLLNALRGLFEMYWEHAIPLGTNPDGEVESPAVDRELLSLLVSGLQDTEIASHLGWTDRTVRRRVREMSTEFGAATRFQAGYEVVRRGILGGAIPFDPAAANGEGQHGAKS